VVDHDVTSVSDELPENISISNALFGVDELCAWNGDARDGVQERLTQHDVRQSSFIHVEPNILSPEGVAFVYQYYL
jgi:hypothetical protein